MKKTSIILLMIFILILALSSFVYVNALPSNMNTLPGEIEFDYEDYDLDDEPSDRPVVDAPRPNQPATAVTPTAQDFFIPENILSIIIITIGIVLVLFSIAIFVRLKQL
ncbi:MAG: hypothetical protein FWC79_02550 [Oscillospiraceae bacterium]|nr:hypothetical protein [Oscillospiraceae bacterium]